MTWRKAIKLHYHVYEVLGEAKQIITHFYSFDWKVSKQYAYVCTRGKCQLFFEDQSTMKAIYLGGTLSNHEVLVQVKKQRQKSLIHCPWHKPFLATKRKKEIVCFRSQGKYKKNKKNREDRDRSVGLFGRLVCSFVFGGLCPLCQLLNHAAPPPPQGVKKCVSGKRNGVSKVNGNKDLPM